MLKRILGLDLGISSIGWTITEIDDNENKSNDLFNNDINTPSFKIIDCGVRLFDEPISKDSSGKATGTSNSVRREKRIGRKRLKRKKLIMIALKQLLIDKGLATKEELGLYINNKNKIDNNLLMLPKNDSRKNKDIWQLRSEVLERELNDFEICRILLHIAKHRGPDFEKNTTLKDLEDLQKMETEKQKSKKDDSESAKMKKSMVDLKLKYFKAKTEDNNITIGKLIFEDREKVKDINNQDKYKNDHIIYREKDKIRNTSDKYTYIISREFLREEIDKIFEIQSKYKNSSINKLDKEVIKNLIFNETETQNIDSMIGFCELEFKTIKQTKINRKGKKVEYEIIDEKNSERRLSRDTFTGQLFSAINAIVNLKVKSNDYNGLLIDYINKNDKKDAIKQILELAIFNKDNYRTELSYSQLKKNFLSDDFLFCNLSYKAKQNNKGKELTEEEIIKKAEDTKFISFESLFRLNKFLLKYEDWQDIIQEINNIDKIIDFYYNEDLINFDKILKIDQLIEIIHLNNSTNAIKKLKDLNYSDDFIQDVIKFNFSKTSHLSYKAIRKILPYMLRGEQYANALEKIPEYKRKFEKEKDYYLKDYAELELVKNPVVRRIFAETKKVINALIRKYKINNKTAFHQINIETTRQLKDFFSKKAQTSKRDSNSKEDLKKEYLELLGLSEDTQVSSNEIFKFKLLKQQDFKSIYTGLTFMENNYKKNACELIRNNSIFLQVDHILPYHRSFDDSQNNKVLVYWDENQEKGDRTPFEWFKSKYKDENTFNKEWNIFKDRVLKCNALTKEKRSNLLNKVFAEQEIDFQARNLNDTGYVSKFLATYLDRHLKFLEIDNLKNHVQRRSGILTATLRDCWSDEFDYESKCFSELENFLLKNIFQEKENIDKNGEVWNIYTINRNQIKSEKSKEKIGWTICEEEKNKIIEFFNKNKIVQENFILEKLLELIADYGSYKEFTTKSQIIQKIKQSMKWGGFWSKENKDRDLSDKHHALDAILISLADQGMVQKLSVCNSIEKEKLIKVLKTDPNNKEAIKNQNKNFKRIIKKIFKAPIVNDKIDDNSKKIRDYIEEFLEERKIKEDNEYFEDYLKELQLNPDKKISRKCRLFISRASNNKISGKLFDDNVSTLKKSDKKPIEDKIGIIDEFDNNNQKRNKTDCFNFVNSQSWARADIFEKINKNKLQFFVVAIYKNNLNSNLEINNKIKEITINDKVINTFKDEFIVGKKEKDGTNLKLDNTYNFKFSLYRNNLILLMDKNHIAFGWYRATDPTDARIKFNNITNKISSDNTDRMSSLNLSIFKKFQVDPLGYINEVKQEKRQGIIEKKCKKQKN